MSVYGERIIPAGLFRHFREQLPQILFSAAAGYLMAAGVVYGALCAGWSITALLGPPAGQLCAALLFAVGSAAACAAEQAGGEWVVLYVTAGSCALCGVSVLRLAATAAALVLICGARPNPRRLVLLFLFVVPGIVCVQEPQTDFMLRLRAVSGCLASAGMCGLSLSRIADAGRTRLLFPVLAGAAAGLIL